MRSIDTKIYPWITNGVGIDWSDCGPIHRCGRDFACERTAAACKLCTIMFSWFTCNYVQIAGTTRL
jgi:hypothetical protein